MLLIQLRITSKLRISNVEHIPELLQLVEYLLNVSVTALCYVKIFLK